MGRVQINTSVNYEFQKEGETIEGYLTGTKDGQGQEGNSCIHSIKTKDGEFINFWGSKVIDEALAEVPFGTYVYIDYHGKRKSKNGGKAYHYFEVFRDDEIAPINIDAPKASAQDVEEEIENAGKKDAPAPSTAPKEEAKAEEKPAKKAAEEDEEDDLPF